MIFILGVKVLKYKVLFLIACILAVVSCTTVKGRNQQIMADYNRINWQDGIDEKEAYYILRHYMHIKNAYYGIRYLYPDLPDEMDHQWVFSTTFRNSSYERDPKQLLTLYIDKTTGEVSSQLPYTIRGRDGAESIERINARYAKVNREDGISRSEAIDIIKHHYYVEAKNRYWMYNMTFVPEESKSFWVFELVANPNAGVSPDKVAKKLNKIDGLYLVVNKKSGEVSKERSYYSVIQ